MKIVITQQGKNAIDVDEYMVVVEWPGCSESSTYMYDVQTHIVGDFIVASVPLISGIHASGKSIADLKKALHKATYLWLHTTLRDTPRVMKDAIVYNELREY